VDVEGVPDTFVLVATSNVAVTAGSVIAAVVGLAEGVAEARDADVAEGGADVAVGRAVNV
jgi:hypothetical protein